jgi:hypothetical protein
MNKGKKMAKILRDIRDMDYNATKNMTAEEKFNYYTKKAKLGEKRLNTIAKQKELRGCQVLIRLTKSERLQLERDAKQAKTTLSSLIRNRALYEKNRGNF